MFLPPPQGSDGFPGVLGAGGEKGKKVGRRVFKIMMILCLESYSSIKILSLVVLLRVLQDNQEVQARGVQM